MFAIVTLMNDLLNRVEPFIAALYKMIDILLLFILLYLDFDILKSVVQELSKYTV